MSKKRMFSLAMAATMLFSATAYGAEVNGTNPFDLEKEGGKFSVTYTEATDGKEYIIWAVKGRETDASKVSFSQENVMYINQNTASGSSVTFDAFLPMKAVESTVLVSGQDMDAPIIVGYIKGEGNTISGTIGLSGRKTNFGGAVVTLVNVETSEEFTATTDTNNAFEMVVPSGVYKLMITKDGYLSYTNKTYEVSSESEWTEEISLLPGDFNGNGRVELQDYGIFRSKFGGTDSLVDLDGNGRVALPDYGLFRSNFGASKTVIE